MHNLSPFALTETTDSPMTLNNSQATGMFSSNLVGGGSKKRRLRKKKGTKRSNKTRKTKSRKTKSRKTKTKRRRSLKGGNSLYPAFASASPLTFGKLTSCEPLR